MTPQRLNDLHPFAPMVGRYAMVHSAPSAWLGYVLWAQESSGVVSVLLADGALWASGMTHDLILPGQSQANPMATRRLGLVSVCAVMGAQAAGALGPVKHHPAVESGLCSPEELPNVSLQVANVLGMTVPDLHRAVLDAYGTPKTGVGNEPFVLKLIPATAFPDLPHRVVASIVLDNARREVW